VCTGAGAGSGSTRFRRRLLGGRSGRLWCRDRFNRVPEKVPEKVWEALEQAEVFPLLGFAARFRKICKNKTLRLLGVPPKLIFFQKKIQKIFGIEPLIVNLICALA